MFKLFIFEKCRFAYPFVGPFQKKETALEYSHPQDIPKAKRSLELGVRTCYHIQIIISEKYSLPKFNKFYAKLKKTKNCEEFFDAIYRAEQ